MNIRKKNPRINRQDRQKITFPGSAYSKEISQQYTPATHTEAVHCQGSSLSFHPCLWPLKAPGSTFRERIAKPLIYTLTPVPPIPHKDKTREGDRQRDRQTERQTDRPWEVWRDWMSWVFCAVICCKKQSVPERLKTGTRSMKVVAVLSGGGRSELNWWPSNMRWWATYMQSLWWIATTQFHLIYNSPSLLHTFHVS